MRLLYLHHIPLNEDRANIVQVLQMCHAFQQVGVDVTLATPVGTKYTSESEMYKIIQRKMGKTPNFKVKRLSNFTIAGRLKAMGTHFGVKSLLRHNGDTDYCFARASFVTHLAVGCGMKTIYESHGAVINSRTKLLDYMYRRWLLRDTKSPHLALFVTISSALADIWKKRGVPAAKILTLHDGFSAEDYDSVSSRNQAREILGIRPENKIVVYAGSLYKDRGIENILWLAKAFSNVGFYVVGGPESDKSFYKALAARKGLNNVFFVGLVPHCRVKDYLFAADVLLMLWTDKVGTIDVCSPLKVFEYMAAEKIIVGYGFPTIREVLRDGETALLAAPNSYQDLERKIRYALSLDYPNKMAHRARKVALERYSWKKRAEAIIERVR